jgi:ATP-dependent Lon protease
MLWFARSFRVIEWIGGFPFYVARAERLADAEVAGPEIEARLLQLKVREIKLFYILTG